jgi:hypothetical protein
MQQTKGLTRNSDGATDFNYPPIRKVGGGWGQEGERRGEAGGGRGEGRGGIGSYSEPVESVCALGTHMSTFSIPPAENT